MTKFVAVVPPQLPNAYIMGEGWALFQSAWLSDSSYQGALERAVRMGWETIIDYQHPTKTETHTSHLTIEEYANRYGSSYFASIVVIPDVYKHGPLTLERASIFLDNVSAPLGKVTKPEFMFVPQGEDIRQWYSCLLTAIDTFGDMFHVIGVPKWLAESSDDDKHVRFRIVDTIGHLPYKFHFLGASERFGLSEFYSHPRVDTWDTSMYIAHAQRGILTSYQTKKEDLLVGENEYPQIWAAQENAYTIRRALVRNYLTS